MPFRFFAPPSPPRDVENKQVKMTGAWNITMIISVVAKSRDLI
jgi:hypothetical protein